MPMFPNSTVAAGTWLDQSASGVDLHSPLADESIATYVQSPTTPSAATMKVGLTDIGTPPAGDVTILIDVEQV